MGVDAARAKALFLAALELADPADRAGFLDRECGGDAGLRERLEALLAAHGRPDDLPDQGAATAEDSRNRLTGAPGTETRPYAPLERPGMRIGPYKLLQEIGEGGMGTVFMAEQVEPVRRRVALKIIKAGMDTAQVIARFEAERQALALMDHPNIAKVLDAGATGGGRPYFVMELVQGVPITKYCDDHKFTPQQRLELFMRVCQAIQHAHQKGIIHRDIKPSNILVTEVDGRPAPKVIDFGVAKATNQILTEKTLFTQFGAIVGTPEYMSPEQAGLGSIDIDTRSDIYSLGVLLYELLTGSTPLRRESLRQAAFTEILRRIQEEEPPTPSSRLMSTVEGDIAQALPPPLASIAANRNTRPMQLSKIVRGDLDWIVMKALDKDRTRRYETANGMARDIQRHLEGDAVEAGPPSASYKLKKFARKHRVALATTAAFAFLLFAATVTSALPCQALLDPSGPLKFRQRLIEISRFLVQPTGSFVRPRQVAPELDHKGVLLHQPLQNLSPVPIRFMRFANPPHLSLHLCNEVVIVCKLLPSAETARVRIDQVLFHRDRLARCRNRKP